MPREARDQVMEAPQTGAVKEPESLARERGKEAGMDLGL